MSSNKRRKLDSMDLVAPRLSAFAARQGLKEKVAQRASNITPVTEKSTTVTISDSSTVSDILPKSRGSPPGETLYTSARASDDFHDTNSQESNENSNIASQPIITSLSQLQARTAVQLSNFLPNKENVKILKNGVVSLLLFPGERLVILGEYRLSVYKGQVTILGATLRETESSRVFALGSHSLPVIRCPDGGENTAEIHLHQSESGLRQLMSLSLLFSKVWNDSSNPFGDAYRIPGRTFQKSSFQILFSSHDTPKLVDFQPVISPPEWNECLSKLSVPSEISQEEEILSTFSKSSHSTQVTLICGPKSSGKSTFARLLTNKLLSIPTQSRSSDGRTPGVAFLDLDPGQPEFSPPGLLSLIHLRKPNFGPPYSHPTPGSKSRVVQAYTMASVTPASGPDLFIRCAINLFMQFQRLRGVFKGCPLVINTPGWVLGTGLKNLRDLISKLKPSKVIYMSLDGPSEVVETLQEATKSKTLTCLPSQMSFSVQTAFQLRNMQYLSYFHSSSAYRNDDITWENIPLEAKPPIEVTYSGKDSGIFGIACYGEQPTSNLLADAINGSFVAIVVLDDHESLPVYRSEMEAAEVYNERNSINDAVFCGQYGDDLGTSHDMPLIIRTKDEDLPYFNPRNTLAFDSRNSQTIGIGLIRGIDIAHKKIQLLTPVPLSDIQEAREAGKLIVLVNGKFDTPGWAYIETLMQKSMASKIAGHSWESTDIDDEFEENLELVPVQGVSDLDVIDLGNRPWIDVRQGSQGGGLGSRVWRVRRDLGKAN